MVRYWFSFTPLVVIVTVVLLTLPWLGLIALMLLALVAIAALGALACGVVFVPRMLFRSVGRRLRSRRDTEEKPALSTVPPHVGPAQSMPAGALLLASPPSDPERLT